VLQGILLIICLGILSGLIAIIMSNIASNKSSIYAFYFMGTGFTCILSWILIVNWSNFLDNITLVHYKKLFLFIGLAGGINAIGQILLIVGMRNGYHGITWTIGQSSIIVPFIASTIIWQEYISLQKWLGMVCVFCAMFLMAQNKPGNERKHIQTMVVLSILTMFVLGTAQTLMGIPSHWANWVDTARLRVPIFMTMNMLVHGTFVIIKKERFNWTIAFSSLIWAISVLLLYFGFFHALDIMAKLQLTSVVFPISVGTSIVFFAIYNHFWRGEKYNKRTIVGILLLLIGIAVIACR